MYDAYHRVFERCGLTFRPVEAQSGEMGGDVSHEFMAVAAVGEDDFVWCTSCDYAANVEAARRGARPTPRRARPPTPPPIGEGAHARPARASPASPSSCGVEPAALLKSHRVRRRRQARARDRARRPRGQRVRARGRARRRGRCASTATTTSPRIPSSRRATSARTSPGASVVVADPSVAAPHRVGHRRERGRPSRAQRGARTRLRRRRVGRHRRASCPATRARAAAKPLSIDRGIEVGHVFQLGTKYSEALDARYTDEHGEQHPMVMGCYGIGVSRDRRRGRRGAPRRARARVARGARAVRRAPHRRAGPRRAGRARCVAEADRVYDELRRARRRRALRRPRREPGREVRRRRPRRRAGAARGRREGRRPRGRRAQGARAPGERDEIPLHDLADPRRPVARSVASPTPSESRSPLGSAGARSSGRGRRSTVTARNATRS